MSTILSRRRWIRFQLILLTLLLTVLIFPSSPRKVRRAVVQSPVYGKIRALVEESYLKRQSDNGISTMTLRLASAYASEFAHYKYMQGDSESLLLPLIAENDVEAISTLAWILRESDPERSKNLFLQAADLGHPAAQYMYLKQSNFDESDTADYMQRLYELQNDRPGWKNSFNHRLRALQDQAAQGNEEARRVLDGLTRLVSSSAES